VSPGSHTLQALVERPVPLVGRDYEFARAMAVLRARRSAVVLLEGRPGMGKSTFLRQIEVEAGAIGWRVARADAHGALTVTPGSTPADIDARIRQLLDLPVLGQEAGPDSSTGKLAQFVATSAAQALKLTAARRFGTDSDKDPEDGAGSGTGIDEGFLGRYLEGAARWVGGLLPGGFAQLLEDLRACAPVLVMVDGCRPSSQFSAAFTRALLAIAVTGDPIVVMIADTEDALRGLGSVATETLRFHDVPEEEIRDYFAHVLADLDPPLEPAELAHYAQTATRSPDIIGPLTRILAVDRRDGRP